MQATMKCSQWEAMFKMLANTAQRAIGGNAKWRYFTTRALVALTPVVQVVDVLRRQTPGADEFMEEDVALITQYVRRQSDGGIAAVGSTNLPDCSDPIFFEKRAALREKFSSVVEAEKEREEALILALDADIAVDTIGISYSDLPDGLPDSSRALLWPFIIDDYATKCAAEVPKLALVTDN